jgi:nucleoside-diphosphate-sugar epimerase
MVKALVTGATGCVGANIAESLSERRYAVRALRRSGMFGTGTGTWGFCRTVDGCVPEV